MNINTIKEYFSIIRDERQSAKVDYPLFDILFCSIYAVIAGGKGWTDIREYVLGHHEWFLKQGLFENGVPVDDTFAHLIAGIDPAEFRECFLGNQGKLSAAVQAAFAPHRRVPIENNTYHIEKQKGRVEARTCHVLKASELEYRYYIGSADLTPEQARNAIRAHWGVESMHWILDVSMREDACQIYRENAAENLAGLRHMALNMLRAEPVMTPT